MNAEQNAFETWVENVDQIAEVFARVVSDTLAAQGRDLASAAAQSTVKTNSTLVPTRGDNLLLVMRHLLGIATMRGLRVLELGSGFGALAAYLAWRERPARMVAVDVSDVYVRVGSRCAADLALDPILTFVRADMRDLSAFGDGEFDLVIANNSFLYVPDRAGARRALSEFNRVLAPGGAVLVYQANRWRWKEPFTGAPVVHLLPAAVAVPLARRTGWRHNHGRVRLSSPPALRLALRRAGFAPTTPITFRHGLVSRWPHRNFGRFFGIAGRKD